MITIPTHYFTLKIDNIISNSDYITNNGTMYSDITDHYILSFSPVKKCDNKVILLEIVFYKILNI